MTDTNEIKEGIGWTSLTQKSAPNFCNETQSYMVRCPKCEQENYVLAVASGICAWCGFNLNQYKYEK